MRKTLRLTTQGNETIIKKIRAKYEAKEKDKNSTLDTYLNTKSTVLQRGKKANISNTYLETSINSQTPCDMSGKDQSMLRLNTPIIGITQERSTLPSSKQSSPKVITIIGPDLVKLIEIKDKEIKRLEEAKDCILKDIKQAKKSLEKKEELSVLIVEKDRKLNDLKIQLKRIEIEINKLVLWRNNDLVPSLNLQTTPTTQQNRTKENSSKRKEAQRLKSSSPRVEEIRISSKDKKKERYKMYQENPAKAFLTQYLKSKTPRISRDPLKPLLLGIPRKYSNKYVQLSPESHTQQKNDSPENSKKLQFILADLINPTPRIKDYVKIKESESASGKKTKENKKEDSKKIEGRKENIKKFSTRRGTEANINTKCSILLGKYASVVEKYKQKTKILSKKNQELERKVLIMNLQRNNTSAS